jgi:CBS-domain-containing membrane protein
MVHDRIAVTAETTIEEAVKIVEEKRLLNLPAKKNGRVACSMTRHDLLQPGLALARREKSHERRLRYGEGQIGTGGDETRVNG